MFVHRPKVVAMKVRMHIRMQNLFFVTYITYTSCVKGVWYCMLVIEYSLSKCKHLCLLRIENIAIVLFCVVSIAQRGIEGEIRLWSD